MYYWFLGPRLSPMGNPEDKILATDVLSLKTD